MDEPWEHATEINQTQNTVWLYAYKLPNTGKFIETKSIIMVNRAWGESVMES